MSERRDAVSAHIDSMLLAISSSRSYNPNIYKVNDEIRQISEGSYNPVLIAIGPIHHNKDKLQDMEKLKLSYLHQFLDYLDDTVDKYVAKLRELEERARHCYSNFIQLPDTDKFVEMLLLDGIFVIVLLLKLQFYDWEVDNEYIFHSSQVRNRIIVDLLLVENQLPFFILCQLFDMSKLSSADYTLSTLVINQMSRVLPWEKDDDVQIADQNVDDHLLGVVHRFYFPRKPESSNNNSTRKFTGTYAVSELEEAGIKFKTADGENLMDASFTDGVLQLPKLQVGDYAETIFRNLIAYEQMQPGYKNQPLSDYSILMMYLVNSPKDIAILRHAGFFLTEPRDDETVHLMFKQLGKNVVYGNNSFWYLEVLEGVNKHCSHRRNKWMANLRRNYFSSPWATLSVIAAIILLLLTMTQTLFTILPFVQ